LVQVSAQNTASATAISFNHADSCVEETPGSGLDSSRPAPAGIRIVEPINDSLSTGKGYRPNLPSEAYRVRRIPQGLTWPQTGEGTKVAYWLEPVLASTRWVDMWTG
jgi:hypothetical protein